MEVLKREHGVLGSCIFASHQNKWFRYTSIISRYSGKGSICVNEINPARLLSPRVTPRKKKNEKKTTTPPSNTKISILKPILETDGSLYTSLQKKVKPPHFASKDVGRTLTREEKVAFARRKLREANQEASKDN